MPRNQRDENLIISTQAGGNIYVSEGLKANATNNVTISNVAPAEVGTATISGWLPVVVQGTTYYIPMWT